MESGIGWHTDSERTMVVGVRFGKPFLLAFQKFSGKEAIGEPLKINLDHGDVYVMSEAAVQGKADGKYKIKHCAGNKGVHWVRVSAERRRRQLPCKI